MLLSMPREICYNVYKPKACRREARNRSGEPPAQYARRALPRTFRGFYGAAALFLVFRRTAYARPLAAESFFSRFEQMNFRPVGWGK
ncbi:hypothetical protein DPQ25_02905 [Hydrogeniiclostridium mannosilyticum]|uniref:Uncharacterized protein n=1 Tax=Hydrogeniiclostridium mannosilyticum TaxID=2764322 RepID=A0A328UFS9_9FIRM|nr:hypothetical protein DPQ25_02905 [Hydrogeniiclostridium mannosilyticum]